MSSDTLLLMNKLHHGYHAQYGRLKMFVLQTEDHVRISIHDESVKKEVWSGEEDTVDQAKETAISAASQFLADRSINPDDWQTYRDDLEDL